MVGNQIIRPNTVIDSLGAVSCIFAPVSSWHSIVTSLLGLQVQTSLSSLLMIAPIMNVLATQSLPDGSCETDLGN